MININLNEEQEKISCSIERDTVINLVRHGYARGIALPWQLKMVLKIILSHLPIPYSLWAKMKLFRHGDVTENLANLQNGFEKHLSCYQNHYSEIPEFCLEIGPGDSVGRALSGFKVGVKGTWFIDVGDFATRNPAHYEAFCRYLEMNIADFERDTILSHTNSRYETSGLDSFSLIADNVIDLSFSNAVLEHIRRDDFTAYMHQLYRVHKNGSLSRHWVDLHDHLGGALNNMRFTPSFWESEIIYRSGFYTNRLTMNEMVECAEKAGFSVDIQRVTKWETLPTQKKTMDACFKDKPDHELNVCTFLMVLEKK